MDHTKSECGIFELGEAVLLFDLYSQKEELNFKPRQHCVPNLLCHLNLLMAFPALPRGTQFSSVILDKLEFDHIQFSWSIKRYR